MANTDSLPQTFVELVLVLLEDHFPCLGTDRDASGSETIDELNELHRTVRTAKTTAARRQQRNRHKR